MPDLPTRIRSERERLGLTQVEAAEQLGMARGSYAQLESGRTVDPRLSTIAALVRAGYRLRAIAPELLS